MIMCSALHILCFASYYVLHCIRAELLSALPKNNVVSLSPILMKSTKVQTLSVMRMRSTANWWVGPRACVYSRGLHTSSWRRVLHELATQVDNMRESTHALSCDFLSLREREAQWDYICILAFSLVFTAYLSNAVVSGKSLSYFSGLRSSEADGNTNRPPRSL